MQKQYVWASKIDFANPFFFPFGPLSHRDSKYFTYVHHWTWFRIAREHLQETSGNHGLLWPLYDSYGSKICQALKSSPQFLAKSLSPCQPPKMIFLKRFRTRMSIHHSKWIILKSAWHLFFCGFILWACWCHPQMLSWVLRHLSSRLSVAQRARGSRFVMPAMQVRGLLAELTVRGIIPRMVSFQFRNV